MSTNMNLRSIVNAKKLTGPNFLDWLKDLRIVLERERLSYVLVEPLPQSLVADALVRVQRAYQKLLVDNARTGLIILTSMSPELHKQYNAMDAYSIVHHLRELYNEHVRTERFKVSEVLFGFKMEEGTSPVYHALKMYEYIERLNQLCYLTDFELSVDLILTSLPYSFAHFVLDYRINNIMSTIPNLINLLKIAEEKFAKRKTKETDPKDTYFYYGQVGR